MKKSPSARESSRQRGILPRKRAAKRGPVQAPFGFGYLPYTARVTLPERRQRVQA